MRGTRVWGARVAAWVGAIAAVSWCGWPAWVAASDVPLAGTYAANGLVAAIATAPDGSTIIGGGFSMVGPATGTAIATPPTGSGEPTRLFGVGDEVDAVAPDGSGGWFIGGRFTSVAGVTRNHLAHLLPDGTLDLTWDPNVDGDVLVIAVAGSNVYFGGQFTTVNGTTLRNNLARTPTTGTGTVDASWNPNVGGAVTVITVSGSDVFFGGGFSTVNGATTRRGIAKTPTAGNGTVDPSWNPDLGMFGAALAIAVAGGDVFFGGFFTTVNGVTTRAGIAKTATTGAGTVDPVWNPDANGAVQAIVVAGTSVFFGGTFTTVYSGFVPRHGVAKTATTGTGAPDAAWNPALDGEVRALAVVGTDLVIGGTFASAGGGATVRRNVAKAPLSGNGTVDATWNPNAGGSVTALASAFSGVFIGGSFPTAGGKASPRACIAKLLADGSLDESWHPDVADPSGCLVTSVAVAGGEVFFGGRFVTVNGGTTRHRLAKTPLGGAGTVDPTWNPDVNDTVEAIAVVGGEVFFGGAFTTANGGGAARGRLAKTPASGSGVVDGSWNPDVNGAVYAITVAGGEVFFGGGFTKANGGAVDRLRAAKTPATGTGAVDSSWTPSLNDVVFAIAVAGGEVFLGGQFTTANAGAVSRRGLAKTATTGPGTVDGDWNPDASGGVLALLVDGGQLYFGGIFTGTSGYGGHRFLARTPLTGTGLADPDWQPALSGGGVWALELAPTLLWAGGNFPVAHGRPAGGLARFALATLVVAPEPPGPNCALGGQRLELAPDGGGTGVLVSYVCNGADGATATVTVSDAPLAQCPYGGQQIDTSVGGGPVVTSYVCDGATGPAGPGAVAVAEAPGPNCPSGGIKVTSGGADQYVCNGLAASVVVTAEPPGAHCPQGGQKIEADSGDGAVTVTYVCNGAPGLVSVADEPAGANCPAGGKRVLSGADANGDGQLDASEVTGTTYVCNGAAGKGCAAGGAPTAPVARGLGLAPLLLVLAAVRRRGRGRRHAP